MTKKKNTYDTFDMVKPEDKEEAIVNPVQNAWTQFMYTPSSEVGKNEKKSAKEE